MLTSQLPVIFDDTVVVGFRYDADRVVGAFQYFPRTGHLEPRALPFDFFMYSTPRFAPDGRHVAYLGRDSTGRGYGVILEWPSGRTVYRGQPAPLLETDAGVDEFTWTSARQCELAIALSMELGGVQRARGTLTGVSGVETRVDTVRAASP